MASESRKVPVRFDQVQKYFGAVKVLEAFDLDVAPGEFLVLLGASDVSGGAFSQRGALTDSDQLVDSFDPANGVGFLGFFVTVDTLAEGLATFSAS